MTMYYYTVSSAEYCILGDVGIFNQNWIDYSNSELVKFIAVKLVNIKKIYFLTSENI